MSAKVFRAPIDPPAVDWTVRYDYEADKVRTNAYLRELAQWCIDRQSPPGSTQLPDFCIGRIISFPIADGAAQYMVMSMRPLQLIHLALHDAWHASAITIRGLRVSDVRQMTKPGLFGEDSHMVGLTPNLTRKRSA